MADDSKPDDGFSDEDIDAALQGLEDDLAGDEGLAALSDQLARRDDAAGADGDAAAGKDGTGAAGKTGAEDANAAGEAPGAPGVPAGGSSVADGIESDMADFESSISELLGESARSAVLITSVRKASVLAVFCTLAHVDAWCVDAPRTGAVAILKDLSGDAPERAAHDLTDPLAFPVILVVNRAGKIDAHQWERGERLDVLLPPPFVLMNEPDFVEDLLIGQTTAEQIAASPDLTVVDTATVTPSDQMRILGVGEKGNSAFQRLAARLGFLRRHHAGEDGEDGDAGEGSDDAPAPGAPGDNPQE